MTRPLKTPYCRVMDRRFAPLPLPLLLLACGSPDPVPGPAEEMAPAVLTETLDAARPEPLIDLLDDPRAAVGDDAACPLVEVLPSAPGVVHERWHGGCRTVAGSTIQGRLERYAGPSAAWVASEGFTVRHDGGLVFALSGSIELQEQGDLVLLDAATTWCGGAGMTCMDGPVPVDLAFTIFPLSGYPAAYDGTVTGAVGASEGVATVEGAWSVDLAACPIEPANGTFSVRAVERHALVMDGATACDACAAWTVGGRSAPAWCSGPDGL
ncbi:MAG: hypothetical protein VX265_17320 [Myxococcota bacterium]|nr:hypothetical protein [Myxococcota bacterium]MEC8422369.1 hypothetical protein [Myxococcota bacterium]